MQDEQFMRQWNGVHEEISLKRDRQSSHATRQLRQRQGSCQAIGNAYGFLDKYGDKAEPKPLISPAAQASLRGLAASVITFGLWIAVMALAMPMPLLASTTDATVGEAQVELA